jgi:hypothetical protein
VKAILLAASSEVVANTLAEDLSGFAAGTWHDETQLVDVGVHACQVLNASGKVIFMTPDELGYARDFVDRAEDDGYRVVVIPSNIRIKLQGRPAHDYGSVARQTSEPCYRSTIGPTICVSRLIDVGSLAGSRSPPCSRRVEGDAQSSHTRSWSSGSSMGDEMNRTWGASANWPPCGVLAGMTQTSPFLTGRVTPPTVTEPVPSRT